MPWFLLYFSYAIEWHKMLKKGERRKENLWHFHEKLNYFIKDFYYKVFNK